MAFGDISLFTVGYTASDAGSLRKNYPIKMKYKQTQATNNPVFPSSYTVQGTTKYWFPYQAAYPSDEDHVVYMAGDEYAWNDALERRPQQLRFADPNLRKYRDYEFGFRIVYINDIYEATNYYFNWTDTRFDANRNPYRTNRVRKWKKMSDTSTSWTQYWYHPLLKRFYVLEDIDEIQELPNFDEPNQSRWDSFIGDSEDLNIENFTLAQIRELISRGQTPAAATSTVANLEQRVLTSAISQPSSVASVLNGTGATFTVTNSAPGQESTSSAVVLESLPSMFQRSINPETGVKTIVDRYYFKLRPNNISYTNIGANWMDIERVNNYPIVDFRNTKPMKISFEFVVEEYSGAISSQYESCEAQLIQLKRMATNSEFVQFINFDSLFGEKIATATVDNNAREFIISDMSIMSVLRTAQGPTSMPGAISRATVNMTVQEVHATKEETIFMPKLPKDPGRRGGGGGDLGDPQPCKELLQNAGAPYLDKASGCAPKAS